MFLVMVVTVMMVIRGYVEMEYSNQVCSRYTFETSH